MKKTVIVVIALTLIGLLLSGCGPRRDHNPEDRIRFASGFIAGELSLSESQKQRMESIFLEVSVKMKEMKSDQVEMPKKIADMIRSDQVTEESINALIDEKLQKFEQVRPFFVRKIVELYSLLDSKQRTKAAEVIEDFHRPGF